MPVNVSLLINALSQCFNYHSKALVGVTSVMQLTNLSIN